MSAADGTECVLEDEMKFLILGAGPAGLTFANRLKQMGETSFLILEKEARAGGLCRSVQVDGAPFDIGGGHFLDVRRPEVNDFLFRFMPRTEWNLFERDSRICIKGRLISHPIEANIWQMDISEQIEYLKSIAAAGCNCGESMPEDFVSWIYWKLGKKIASDYMIPYNQKMYGERLNKLGTYWLEKLPNVSFEETLRSCLERRAYGSQPGHTNFYYPKKYGYGELWKRMGEAVKEHIEYNREVYSIDFSQKTVRMRDGGIYNADTIITTIPWRSFDRIDGISEELKAGIERLEHSSIQTEYFRDSIDTKAHWIYYPDLNLPYHRILVRHNFCPGSRGYWTETNGERICSDNSSGRFRYMNHFAYPLNTRDKPAIMKQLLKYAAQNGIYGLGRWGEHQHYNSDVTVGRALQLCQKLG